MMGDPLEGHGGFGSPAGGNFELLRVCLAELLQVLSIPPAALHLLSQDKLGLLLAGLLPFRARQTSNPGRWSSAGAVPDGIVRCQGTSPAAEHSNRRSVGP